MKRKIYILIAVILFWGTLSGQAMTLKEKLPLIGFNMLIKKDAKAEITKVIEQQERYANKKNYTKLKALYTADYKNFDGFTLDEYIISFQRSAAIGSKIKYHTQINLISVNGNYATVTATDTAEGETEDSYQNIDGTGFLKSTSESIYYLRKVNGDWKISSDMAITEKTVLAYGTAKDMVIELQTPDCITSNASYDAVLKIENYNDAAVIASITAEPIQFKQTKQEDVFRPLSQNGTIERVLTSNNEGKNEIVYSSIAVARALPVDLEKIKIVIDGAAFAFSRVNVVPKR